MVVVVRTVPAARLGRSSAGLRRWLSAPALEVVQIRRGDAAPLAADPPALERSLAGWRRRVRRSRVPAALLRSAVVVLAVAALTVLLHRAAGLATAVAVALPLVTFVLLAGWSLLRPLPLDSVARLLD